MSAFNQNPIIVDSPMTQSFWATLRAAGVLAAGQGKPIQVTSIKWLDAGLNATYAITDASASHNTLDNGDTGPDFTGSDPVYTFFPPKHWRDWQVTQLTGGRLQIQYV